MIKATFFRFFMHIFGGSLRKYSWALCSTENENILKSGSVKHHTLERIIGYDVVVDIEIYSKEVLFT